SMHDVFDAISTLASESGVKVEESEIVGLVPQEAITKASVHYLSLSNFSPNQIIENRIFAAEAKSSSPKLVSLSLGEFADRVSSKSPTPGGGSVAAYAGALAASLVAMVCELTIDRKKYESSWARAGEILGQSLELKSSLLELVDRDAAAYEQVSAVFKLPKSTDEEKAVRQNGLVAALKNATEVPRNTVQFSHRVLLLANEIGKIGNKNAVSDAQTASQLSKAAILGAFDNVKINLDGLPSEEAEYSRKIYQDLEPIIQEVSR
ncbi:MAG TPA: cyclodeaminase/cyclohydrolase family protein, partial [Nitrososphaerales archaeon]|nr:cyclodeaminase/cyclohydrolase family protein [Nitrososphaerales archaeon]